MEHIKVTKVHPSPPLLHRLLTYQVANVERLSRGQVHLGTLHLTAHHLIFSFHENDKHHEMWVAYPTIHTVERRLPLSLGIEGCALRFRCRDFNFFTLTFKSDVEGKDVFESVRELTCVGIISDSLGLYL